LIKSAHAARLKVNHTPSPPLRVPTTTTTTITTTSTTNDTTNLINIHPNAIMVNQSGADVRVAFVDFDDAGKLKYYQEHERNNKVYIRVVTDDQFIVMVDITPEFDFKGQPHVQIRVTIDGEEDIMYFLSAYEVSTLNARDLMRRINLFDTERFVNRKWMSCALSFAELEIDDSIVQSKREALEDSINLGSIVVKITRGKISARKHEKMFPRECAKDITAASRAVVETHHVTHTCKALPLSERGQPWVQWEFTPAPGVAGRPQETTIFYRSQEALELLHVIPQTVDVKNDQEGRQDLTTKKRAPVRPDLDAEADIKIGDITASSKAQEEQHPPVGAALGAKRKRNATFESNSASKKTKLDTPSIGLEPTPGPPSSGTRSKRRLAAQGNSKVVDTAAEDTTVQDTAVEDQDAQEDGHKSDGVAGRLFGRLSSLWSGLTQGRADL
jgi:hypothetical protein